MLAKVGLDSHSRGIQVVARALRDAGFEVIYTGLHKTPEQIVYTAVQEDVDIVGVSILSGAHLTLIPKIMRLLEENGLRNIPLVVGGIIPTEDRQALQNIGVARVFGPGSDTQHIAAFIKQVVTKGRTTA